MTSHSQGRSTARYVVQIGIRPCSCPVIKGDVRESRSKDQALHMASAIWALILVFWVEYPINASVSVVDSRDGTTVWRNGRHQAGEEHNATSHEN